MHAMITTSNTNAMMPPTMPPITAADKPSSVVAIAVVVLVDVLVLLLLLLNSSVGVVLAALGACTSPFVVVDCWSSFVPNLFVSVVVVSPLVVVSVVDVLVVLVLVLVPVLVLVVLVVLELVLELEVGLGVGLGVGFGVEFGVGFGVGLGVGFSVGLGVGLGVGAGVGLCVAASVGEGVGGQVFVEHEHFVVTPVQSRQPWPADCRKQLPTVIDAGSNGTLPDNKFPLKYLQFPGSQMVRCQNSVARDAYRVASLFSLLISDGINPIKKLSCKPLLQISESIINCAG